MGDKLQFNLKYFICPQAAIKSTWSSCAQTPNKSDRIKKNNNKITVFMRCRVAWFGCA